MIRHLAAIREKQKQHDNILEEIRSLLSNCKFDTAEDTDAKGDLIEKLPLNSEADLDELNLYIQDENKYKYVVSIFF